jgi:RHS repeat-associated protein
VADENGNIEQINHYYPFGGLMGESQNLTSNQKYKYNGKELDRMHGLDWYDYGARNYDGMRFTTMDPLAEKYYSISSYAYCGNNPINAFDPDGTRTYNVRGVDGTTRKETIDDGVNKSYDIEEQYYSYLLYAFGQQQINDNNEYNDYLEALALGTKGYEVACEARRLATSESEKYSLLADAGDGFVGGLYKCNKFAYDVLTTVGAMKLVKKGKHIPPAKDYAEGKSVIKGKIVSTDNYEARLGDVIGGKYNFSDATGHVEIVTQVYPKSFSGEFQSTGAHDAGAQSSSTGYKMVNKIPVDVVR